MRSGVRFAHLSMLLCASAAACNAITGAKERTLDPDFGSLPERDGGDDDDDATTSVDVLEAAPNDDVVVVDGGSDGEAGPIVFVIDMNGAWSSPNGATATKSGGGVKIGGFDGAANNHPVIVPLPQPNLGAEDYTFRATVLAPAQTNPIPEFGIYVRPQSNGAGVVVANVYGASPPAFIGNLTTSWNPTKNATGPDYVYAASIRYSFWARVRGNEVAAKLWKTSDPEPASPQMIYPSPYATGRGVGFYTYGLHEAVLESMSVTVP